MQLAIEWFLNPDHLPLLIAEQKGFFINRGIDNFKLIVPDAHYDGLQQVIDGNIEFATNEPLHLIEQYHEELLSLGTFFQTLGGVMLRKGSLKKLEKGQTIRITTPVSNPKTDGIAFEIVRRYTAARNIIIHPEQLHFEARDFYHLKNMQAENFDGAWLYFYNFEGVEAQHAGLDLIFLDAETADFPNFCGLDLFTSKATYHKNPAQIHQFIAALHEAITFIQQHPEQAKAIYYDYTQEAKTPLTDDIITATIPCFQPNFQANFKSQQPILSFFRDLGITDLSDEQFKTAFLSSHSLA